LALADQYDTESDEYKQKAAELAEHYKQLTGFTLEELNDFVNRGTDLYEQFGMDTVKTYEDTVLGQMNTAYSSFSQLHESVSIAITTSANAVSDAHSELRDTIDTAMKEAGTSINDFKDDYNKLAKDAKKESKEIAKEVAGPGGLKEQMCNAFVEIMRKVNEWYTNYGSTANNLKTVNEQIISSVNLVTAAYAALER
jgi:hypothetical protein